MNDFLIKVLPRLCGFVLLAWGCVFIPRNLLPIYHKLDERWTTKRVIFALCWLGIVTGYEVSGLLLVGGGWRAPWSYIAFAVAMLCFIPVPCHQSIFNTNLTWRRTRTAFFCLLAILTIALGIVLST